MATQFQLPVLHLIDISLTRGTSIPPPAESPIESPIEFAAPRPPTLGGGPLSSHPTSPSRRPSPPRTLTSTLDIPGAFPQTPLDITPVSNPLDRARSPLTASPISPPTTTPSLPRRLSPTESLREKEKPKRPSSVRKFLSLRSLRSSSNSNSGGDSSSSVTSPVSPGEEAAGRPDSPYTTASSATSSRPSLRRKRSTGWFKSKEEDSTSSGGIVSSNAGGSEGRRKSGMWTVGTVRRVDEVVDANAYVGVEAEREKSPSSPPTLPDWEGLGASLDGGSLGGEDLFKDIK